MVASVLPWPAFELGDPLATMIEKIAPTLRASEDEAERLRHLPDAAVAALREAGLFRISAPSAVGGLEASPVVEMEVFEAVTRASGSAGWNLFVGALHTALPAAYVSDEAAADLWGGDDWAVVAGQMAPLGLAHEVDGGLRVSGRYSWGSGFHHATWVLAGVRVAPTGPDGGEPTGFRVVVVPKAQVRNDDNWHVLGVAGSGSYDYALDDVFVPDGYWFDFLQPVVRRGGRKYAPPVGPQISSAHCGYALGTSERALEEIAVLAGTKQRALASTRLAERGAFQRDLGRAHAMVSAARDHCARVLRAVYDRRMAGDTVPTAVEAELRAAATWATEVAVDVAHLALKYSGGTGVRQVSPIQRVLREALMAQSHVHVVDTNYDNLGLAVLAAAGAEGLGAVRAGYR